MMMIRSALNHLPKLTSPFYTKIHRSFYTGGGGASSSSPSLSIWRRKKELGKEGLIIAKELKRHQSHPLRLDRFIKTHVSRLLKSDLVAVLAEFQRQDLVFLSLKVHYNLDKCIFNSF